MVDNGQSFNKSLSHRSRISLPDHLSSKTLNFSKLQTSGIIANLNDDADSQSTLVSAMELMESSEMLFGLGPTQCVEELRLVFLATCDCIMRASSCKCTCSIHSMLTEVEIFFYFFSENKYINSFIKEINAIIF